MAKLTPLQETLVTLVRQPGWKAIEGILESQWLNALSIFREAKTIDEFLKAQAIINQVEGLFNQVKAQISIPNYGKENVKQITDFNDVLRQG